MRKQVRIRVAMPQNKNAIECVGRGGSVEGTMDASIALLHYLRRSANTLSTNSIARSASFLSRPLTPTPNITVVALHTVARANWPQNATRPGRADYALQACSLQSIIQAQKVRCVVFDTQDVRERLQVFD